MSGTSGILLPRDTVRVSGSDAAVYLQGQISQDVESLAVGCSAWSLALTPRGRIEAWFRITRRDDDFLLDLDHGFGAVLAARLERFKLRVDVTVKPRSGWQMLAAREMSSSPESSAHAKTAQCADTDAELRAAAEDAGARERGAESLEAASPGLRAAAEDAEICAAVDWPAFKGVDLVGPLMAMPPDLPVLTESEFQAARIRAGWPVMGSEFTERTIPAEVAGLVESSVSFTKGCYTGQELVARIDSRNRNVPHPVRLLEIATTGGISPGDEVVVDGAAVGAITSVAVDRRAEATVALAAVRRRVRPPAAVLVNGRPAAVRALPV